MRKDGWSRRGNRLKRRRGPEEGGGENSPSKRPNLWSVENVNSKNFEGAVPLGREKRRQSITPRPRGKSTRERIQKRRKRSGGQAKVRRDKGNAQRGGRGKLTRRSFSGCQDIKSSEGCIKGEFAKSLGGEKIPSD